MSRRGRRRCDDDRLLIDFNGAVSHGNADVEPGGSQVERAAHLRGMRRGCRAQSQCKVKQGKKGNALHISLPGKELF